jgi:hypothetical protein
MNTGRDFNIISHNISNCSNNFNNLGYNCITFNVTPKVLFRDITSYQHNARL